MTTYFLIGLIFYLLSMWSNNAIWEGWKEKPLLNTFVAAVFIVLWFPTFLVYLYTLLKKNQESG